MEPLHVHNLAEPAGDPVFAVVNAWKADAREDTKVNLAVGAYADRRGRAICFETVKKAFDRISKDPCVTYLTPGGDAEFCQLSQKLLFCLDLADSSIASTQSISGTGALTLAANLMKSIISPTAECWVPDPTWAPHATIFGVQQTFNVKRYKYWCAETRGVAKEQMRADLESAAPKSILVLHACAHNPTGQDITHEDWEWVFDLCERKHHCLLIDCAYQGFASGDFGQDGWAVRRALCHVRGGRSLNVFVAQSFAKNMGLYGHRIGCFHAICSNPKEAQIVSQNVAVIARRIWSNPPRMGSDIVKLILNDPDMRSEWLAELKATSNKIMSLRRSLRQELESRTGRDWTFLTNQIGMFGYTGLSVEQVQKLRTAFGIYLLDSGRISLAALQQDQIAYVAEAIASVSSNLSG